MHRGVDNISKIYFSLNNDDKVDISHYPCIISTYIAIKIFVK